MASPTGPPVPAGVTCPVFVQVIEALVAAGANVAIRNNAGDTPLDLAYKKKSKAAVIATLEAAAR